MQTLLSGNLDTTSSFAHTFVEGGLTVGFGRSSFAKTTLHVPGGNFTVQVSNVYAPTDDSDWVTISSAKVTDDFAYLNMPVQWVRVQGVTAGQTLYVQSNQYHY